MIAGLGEAMGEKGAITLFRSIDIDKSGDISKDELR